MKVTVKQGIQVVHGGERYADSATVDVPDELAGKWLRAGWVSEEDSSPEAGKPRPASRRTR